MNELKQLNVATKNYNGQFEIVDEKARLAVLELNDEVTKLVTDTTELNEKLSEEVTLTENVLTFEFTEEEGYIDENGNEREYTGNWDGETGTSYYRSGFTELPQRQLLIRQGTNDIPYVVFYDEYKNFVSYLSNSDGIGNLVIVTSPVTAKYARFIRYCGKIDLINNGNAYTLPLFASTTNIPNIVTDVERLKAFNTATNAFDYTVETGFISTSGVETPFENSFDGETGTSYFRTNYISIPKGRLYIKQTTVSVPYVVFFDENKNYVSNCTESNGYGFMRKVEIPQNATFMRMVKFNGVYTPINGGKPCTDDFECHVNVANALVKLNESKFEPEKPNILLAFDKIIAIGDSITYGQVYTSDTEWRQSYSPYPKALSKLIGAEYSIFASPGDTAIAAWNRHEGKLPVEVSPNTLYIIFLGTNSGLTDTLDTDASESVDFSEWAETNTGSYAKLVQTALNSGGRVLLIKPSVTGGGASLDTTNAVIEQIAEQFGCAYIDGFGLTDLKYHYFPDFSGSNDVHYNDLGYSAMADEIVRMVAQLSDDIAKYLIIN